MFAGKKSAQIREILISESAWEEMTCLFAPSLGAVSIIVAIAIATIGIETKGVSVESLGIDAVTSK
ncbi:hypothetical protein HV314_14695 [Citrobacter sp. RHBSTW-00887]|nr:hypothetical protein HV314_14695 [Citrobacter sp. RHBSTW-00887]